jgi:lipopolysaccharide transport system ATP-binding protein
MSDVVIRAENLSKKYRIEHRQEHQRYVALRDVFANKISSSWRRLNRWNAGPQSAGSRQGAIEDFWALKDVSFDIKQGEVVGIIGRNGAGKSTLLKILSRITEPTKGRVRIRGRVASLLEVGTGFHPELTGRENIYLNGAILGMTRLEIARKFDEIVAFAEVEQFLDTPVKRYSSGMYVRLAFAVAAHLEPEILIVDEVLAVGDANFQKKCLGKMEHVAAQGGRTVLFVSHNMAAIEGLCASAVLLSKGRVVEQGNTKRIVQEYLTRESHSDSIPLDERIDREGTGDIRFTRISIAPNGSDGTDSSNAFQCGANAELVLSFRNLANRELRNLRVALGVDNEMGQRVLLLDSVLLGQDVEKVSTGDGQVSVSMPSLPLIPGRYRFTIYSTVNGVIADWIKDAGCFDVEAGDYYGTGQLPPQGQGLFLTRHAFKYQPMEDGREVSVA